LEKLATAPLYPVLATALASGCRRGELLALRWRDLDLGEPSSAPRTGRLSVNRSLEQTKPTPENPTGLRFKTPKTAAGVRTLTIPAAVVAILRAHRRTLGEERLALGLGALGSDDLVLGNPDGTPRNPNTVSTEWVKLRNRFKLPRVSLHAF